jgi:acyl carrier protein
VERSGERIERGAGQRGSADLAVVSLGGPTETTIWNIVYPIGPDEDGSRSIPYGKPNANNRLYVLDQYGRDAPDWVPGEICAAGIGLARGYWRDEQRTAERFYHDARRAERLYRTGDIGRYLPDGNIEIIGRSDNQLKVNGYRIEAGEVETRLAALDAVRQAVVVRQDGTNGARLVAHLVTATDVRPPDRAMRDELATQLPDYMIPSSFVWHERLPLTRNGKVDRTELATSAPVPRHRVPSRDSGARSATEQALAELWASVLGLPSVGLDDKFTALGGDSIAAARVVTRVRKRYGVAIPMHRLADVDTVRTMAAHVEAARAGDSEGAPERSEERIERGAGSGGPAGGKGE